MLGSRNLHFLKSDLDWVHNWPQNRLKWGRGSESSAAHIQQKLTQVIPPGSYCTTGWALKQLPCSTG